MRFGLPVLLLVCVFFLLLLQNSYSQPFGMSMDLTLVDESCNDTVQNQNETGVDCGGVCPACPTCFDGLMNQDETNIDCGGVCTACPTCSDGIKNQGESGVDCGGPCSDCESDGGGGGGGGGGGSSTPYPYTPVSKSLLVLKANDTGVFDFNMTDVAIYKVEVIVVRNITNFTITLKNMETELNVPKQNITEHTYQYAKISIPNAKIKDFSDLKIWFRVQNEWVMNKSLSEILLARYSEDWAPLKTTFIGNDSLYFYFEAEEKIPGIYAIIGKEIEEPEKISPLVFSIKKLTAIVQDNNIDERTLNFIAAAAAFVIIGLIFTLLGRHISKKLMPSEFDKRMKELEKNMKKT
jgi:PGF-pre-PGF domain-containing protein